MKKEMATHSSTLAWRIPWTEDPGGLQSMGLQSRTWLKRLSMHACVGEGNGNLLQYSCLENPSNGGAWWATVYGVAQNRTRLKQLSSSSSRRNKEGRFWDYFKLGILNCILNFHSHFSCSVIWGHLDLSSLSTASYSLSLWNRWYHSIHCQIGCLHRRVCKECSKTQCLRNDCMFFDSGITEQKRGFSGRKLQLP